jgi:DNA replication ATP-dependent helicase Dna2
MKVATHITVIMPLAKACLLAGDPEQLSPILRSTDRLARQWLG